jgi:(p)ppGpp synthase/HD superfamily hydrolase
MAAYSPVLDRALSLAATAHREQLRKGSAVPYIAHPAHAAMILLKYQFPEAAVVAAVLHDVVEDTEVPLSKLEAEFGAEVARLVERVSEKKKPADSHADPHEKLPWRVRKEEQLERLSEAEPMAAAVKSADALHNCHSMLRDLREQGDKLWGRFRASQADQLWYYTTLAAVLRQRLEGHPICDELDQAVAELVALCENPGTRQ